VDSWIKACVWNALVYLVSLYSLGVPLWKSVAVMVIVFIATRMRYGAHLIFRGGVLLMFIAIAVWIHVLPPPQQWPDAQEILARLRS
jgi:hypothetical protein